MKLKITTDCAQFYPESNLCIGVTDVMCGKGTCPFYQTKEEKRRSMERWCRRMKSLPRSTQAHIAKKYYHGEYIWLEVQSGKEV